MDKRKKVTISICVTPEIDEQLQLIANELSIKSKSAVVTALLATSIKWCNVDTLKTILNSVYGKENHNGL